MIFAGFRPMVQLNEVKLLLLVLESRKHPTGLLKSFRRIQLHLRDGGVGEILDAQDAQGRARRSFETESLRYAGPASPRRSNRSILRRRGRPWR